MQVKSLAQMMSKTKVGPTHLVIPDPHAKYGQDMRRFDWLAQIILAEKPDVIICLGDLGDMPSLSSYDRGTKGFEGRRYWKDIEAVHDALARIKGPIDAYNATCKTKKYDPRWVMLYGNHENRIKRATNADSMLDGTISVEDLKYEEFGWETVPFLDEIDIDGVAYSHYFVSGVMARPIGGEHPATMLLNKRHKSCTAGHLHLADWSQRTVVGGQHIMGCLAGCYLEDEEDYVPTSVNQMWWKGLVIKRNVVDGVYDPQFLSLNTIKRMFGVKEGE
jgi:hypothetical protein